MSLKISFLCESLFPHWRQVEIKLPPVLWVENKNEFFPSGFWCWCCSSTSCSSSLSSFTSLWSKMDIINCKKKQQQKTCYFVRGESQLLIQVCRRVLINDLIKTWLSTATSISCHVNFVKMCADKEASNSNDLQRVAQNQALEPKKEKLHQWCEIILDSLAMTSSSVLFCISYVEQLLLHHQATPWIYSII